jgi:ABC-type sugar transport system ATPase subunit
MTPRRGETLVTVDSVRVTRAGREVLRGVDLEVQAGEIVVLVGPNGAGKSTLLAAIAGLLPVAAGMLHCAGKVVTVLQTPALANRTVLANIELATRWAGPRQRKAARQAKARAALEQLNAGGLAGRHASTLSGGEARRVHLARGLVAEPDVLLLDEPFAGLDPTTRADLLYDAASALRHESRATVVVVHDRAEAWALADRVAVVLGGTIAASGTPTDVFTHPPTEAVADFVGFSGRLADGGDVIRLRPADVEVSEAGRYEGTVRRLVPVEDGVRIQLATTGGEVVAIGPAPGPPVGGAVRFNVKGGVRFVSPPADRNGSRPAETARRP